ncbi:MAG: hypothetical protein V5A57_01795 [Candidatus Paceibacterota bacterium]
MNKEEKILAAGCYKVRIRTKARVRMKENFVQIVIIPTEYGDPSDSRAIKIIDHRPSVRSLLNKVRLKVPLHFCGSENCFLVPQEIVDEVLNKKALVKVTRREVELGNSGFSGNSDVVEFHFPGEARPSGLFHVSDYYRTKTSGYQILKNESVYSFFTESSTYKNYKWDTVNQQLIALTVTDRQSTFKIRTYGEKNNCNSACFDEKVIGEIVEHKKKPRDNNLNSLE